MLCYLAARRQVRLGRRFFRPVFFLWALCCMYIILLHRYDDTHVLFWAIIKNGYTLSVWSQKRVQPGVKKQIHPTSHAKYWPKTHDTRFGEKKDPSTPVNGMLGFQPFLVIIMLNHLPILVVYVVLHCCFRHLLVFRLFCFLSIFTTSTSIGDNEARPHYLQ